MEKVNWKVEGMTCSNCALTISRYLENRNLKEVKLNVITGALSFEIPDRQSLPEVKSGIQALGYQINEGNETKAAPVGLLGNNQRRFLFTLPFTLLLSLHMLPGMHFHWLMQPLIQMLICLPVFLIGLYFFGRSAWKSIRNGMPNMNTLISIGAIASFTYSLAGMLLDLGADYLFFETTAAIINLVFLGNYLEEAAVSSTQTALKKLAGTQKVMANMIAFDGDHKEQIFTIDNSQLKGGDLVLIREGEKVPADCKILWGSCAANESIITGESLPVDKHPKDKLIGGSILSQGTVKAQVTAAGEQTILSGILQMISKAQSEKPPVQKMADRISAIFVPVVILLAISAFLLNLFGFDLDAGASIMRAVAVLVIACPCAMGLATPAGIAVGMGRAARNGILFRKPSALESFQKISRVVFDKTGTLTTGKFNITSFHSDIREEDFKRIVFSLEKYSGHPLGKSIAGEWTSKEPIRWKSVSEKKGIGIIAEDSEGNLFMAGSSKILDASISERLHNVYITKNGVLIGWIDLEDEIRPEAGSVIQWLKKRKITTVMLSGDKLEKCEAVAKRLGIDEVIAEQLPEEKMQKIRLMASEAPTAMVGDGINDAPALAQSTLGISISEASDIAVQHADVILMSGGLRNLPMAMGLGRHTYLTIRQNLFWAFFYNIIAIPVAAMGLLTPGLAALAMGFSDVILAANSIRLFVKKVA
jgi:Cu+-exporting ATPase